MSEKETKKSSHDLQSPKGMRDCMGDQYYRYQGFFEKAQEIAVYYGFNPIETPMMEHEEVFMKTSGEGSDIVDKEIYTLKTKGGDRLALRPEGTAATMRAYLEHGMIAQPQPLYLYTYGARFRHDKPQKGRYRQLYQFDLEIIGKTGAVLDATIIEVATLILKETGIKNPFIKINSIGDKDSRKEYLKHLTNYYKKHLTQLGAIDRARLKTNPLRILDSKDPKTIEINADAPQSLNYLNNESKKHFKQVIEYLDECGINYEIDHTLVRGLDYYTHTIFEFFGTAETENGEEKQLALGGGGRYDYLAKTLGSKKDIPGVGCGLGVDRILEVSNEPLDPKIKKEPKVFFIQLGFEAKLKSFKIIEILRKKKIPVKHSLAKDNLGSQLALAEKMEVPYTIIFGQKEAMDGTVIVRNMQTRAQEIIKITDLADYTKHMK